MGGREMTTCRWSGVDVVVKIRQQWLLFCFGEATADESKNHISDRTKGECREC